MFTRMNVDNTVNIINTYLIYKNGVRLFQEWDHHLIHSESTTCTEHIHIYTHTCASVVNNRDWSSVWRHMVYPFMLGRRICFRTALISNVYRTLRTRNADRRRGQSTCTFCGQVYWLKSQMRKQMCKWFINGEERGVTIATSFNITKLSKKKKISFLSITVQFVRSMHIKRIDVMKNYG